MFFKNKLLAILLTGIVSFSCLGFSSQAMEVSDNVFGWPAGPEVNAESAIVLEAKTGAVLYSKDADVRQYPASITKIMTVLLALENASLDETVTFSRNAVYSIERDSSHIARTDGEELTMEQCLYAIMLESANECSNAVAEHIAGSVEAFAEMMNERAAQLGCTDTHFVNPHGLHDDEHYITARDMALITQEALKNETFRTIAGSVRYKIPPTNKNDEELTMNHHHSMISKHRTAKYFDDTVFAGKNGFTTNSLNTLVTCATRNDMELIVVVLRCASGTPYTDTAALLDYAEENFTKCSLPGVIADLPTEIAASISDTITGFDSSNAFLTEDSCAYAIVPSDMTFDHLDPAVASIDKTDGTITVNVSYSYKDIPVGSTSWYMSITQEDTSADVPVEESEEIPDTDNTKESNESLQKVIRITLIVIGIVILILLIIILLLFIRAMRIKARRRRRRATRRYHNSSRRSTGRRPARSSKPRRQTQDFDDFDF